MQYTTNYSLKKPQYADEADIEIINDNTDDVDTLIHQNRTMIAPAFDNTKAYVTGDPVEYLGALYVFTSDKAAGAWDASKVEPTTAAEMGGGGASALADLDDVEITSPTDGQTMKYNSTSQKWENGKSDLGDLGDVEITTPTEGQVLIYNEDDDVWENQTLPDASVTKEATGNPIELTDAASAPMVKCVSAITGYQEGTGTPSPENVRPITAYTEGEIEVRGKNILPLVLSELKTINTAGTWNNNVYTLNSMNFTVNTDGSDRVQSIRVNGNTRLGAGFYLANNFVTDGSVFLSGCPVNGSTTTYYLEWVNNGDDVGAGVAVQTPVAGNIRFRVVKINTDYDFVIYPMLERGTAKTDYEPYTSTTHTTTYPTSIYRGSEDVVNGKVTTEWGMIASYAGETLPGEWISDRDEYVPGTTPTTGAQVAYELATTTTSSVTPTNLPIKSLSGYSHIESSTGEMEVEYITEGEQAIVDLIPEVEANPSGSATETLEKLNVNGTVYGVDGLPDSTGASNGDVLTLSSGTPVWAAPAGGGGGGAYIDTSNVIQGYTRILEYGSLNYTATQDCCVVFEIYPDLNGLNSIIIDNVTVKAVFGALGNSGGYGVTDYVFLKAGQSLVVQYNGQNYLGHYYVYGVM